jgi:multicomponent Na+:H+ antiporter subunit G
MITYLVLFLLVIGAITILVASIGLLRMPDFYLRISAVTIAGTFGVGAMLLAAAIYFLSFTLTMHVLGGIIFLVLTVPIGSQLLGRAAYIMEFPVWKGTMHDDLKDKSDTDLHIHNKVMQSADISPVSDNSNEILDE